MEEDEKQQNPLFED